MSRYIDAEAFFKLINTTLPYGELDYPDKVTYNAAISDVLGMLTHFPAADVVEVVRCKECKYADLFYPYCTIWEAAIDEDGYCYKGEKE